MIGGIVLAAGAGTRFGGGKQLALLDGRPLLEHAVRGMTSAPVGRVIVVLGAEAEHVLARVDLHGAEPVVCERWSEGQSASLACGLGEMADCEAVVVTLGDQPRVSPDAIRRSTITVGVGPASLGEGSRGATQGRCRAEPRFSGLHGSQDRERGCQGAERPGAARRRRAGIPRGARRTANSRVRWIKAALLTP